MVFMFEANISQCQATTSKAGSGEVYAGVFTSLKRMWQQEGFAGFMKGNGINVVRVGHWATGAVETDPRYCPTLPSNSRHMARSRTSFPSGLVTRFCPHPCASAPALEPGSSLSVSRGVSAGTRR